MDETELIAACEEYGKEFKDEMGLKVFFNFFLLIQLYDKHKIFIYCFCTHKCLLEWVKYTNQSNWEKSVSTKTRIVHPVERNISNK